VCQKDCRWQEGTALKAGPRKRNFERNLGSKEGGVSMAWKRRVRGGIVSLIGYMLSPLSWWNDLFVNFPLAIAFGWLIGLVYKPAFEMAAVVGYWLTNVAGLVLLHKGSQTALSNEKAQPYSRRNLLKDFLISLAYTGVILILVKAKLVRPVSEYF
jgi:hypothetical protein